MNITTLNNLQEVERTLYTKWIEIMRATGSSSKELAQIHDMYIKARAERLRYLHNCDHVDTNKKPTFVFNKMFGVYICSFCNREAYYSAQDKGFILYRKGNSL